MLPIRGRPDPATTLGCGGVSVAGFEQFVNAAVYWPKAERQNLLDLMSQTAGFKQSRRNKYNVAVIRRMSGE
jgi:hypothetical protein